MRRNISVRAGNGTSRYLIAIVLIFQSVPIVCNFFLCQKKLNVSIFLEDILKQTNEILKQMKRSLLLNHKVQFVCVLMTAYAPHNLSSSNMTSMFAEEATITTITFSTAMAAV